MHRCRYVFGILIFFAISPTFGAGQNESNDPKTFAVQPRPYDLVNELTIQGGYLPLDSFNRYVYYGGVFTHYFNGYEGWEVLNVMKAINYDTGLTAQLQKSFLVSTYPFNTLDYALLSNFVYTPIFNKSIWGQNTIIRGETSFVGGGGLAKFDSGFSNELDAGLTFRFFLGSATSLKFDIRYHFYFVANTQNNLQLGAAFAYSFGSPEGVVSPTPEMQKEKENEKENE